VGSDAQMTDKKYDWEETTEYGYPVVRVWYRNNDVPVAGIGRLIKFFRYLKATSIAWKLIYKRWGMPQVNHVHIYTRPTLLAFYLRFLYGIPFLITEHSSHFVHDLPVLLPPKKWFAQYVSRSAKFVTAVSKTLEKAMDDFGFHGNYRIVPNVIFVKENMLNIVKSDEIRIVAIAGSTDGRKNISGLIETFGRIYSTIPMATLQIVRPVKDDMIFKKAEDTGLLNSKIFFHDYLSNNDVYDLLFTSSFLVVNSLSETFSMAAAEALSCGKPVISTRCGGPEEFINDDLGRLIEVNNPEKLAEALQWMYSNFKTFESEKLKTFVKENYSMEVVGKLISNLYTEMLDHKSQ
jgi:glycosyltransferase involved in cell wall biosynthesis